MSLRLGGGIWRGRKIAAPDGMDIRPTSDRARSALFNLLRHGKASASHAEPLPVGLRVLDIFAGTGALGLEALSRGAAQATFIDNNPVAQKIIRANIALFGAEDRTDILNRDATKPGQAGAPFDLVLMDSPYRSNLSNPSLTALVAGGWLTSGAILVVEMAATEKLTVPDGFLILDQRTYGVAQLVILEWRSAIIPLTS